MVTSSLCIVPSSNVPSATARKLLHTTMEQLFSVPPDEVSLLGAMVLARGGGTFQYYIDATNTETHLIEGGSPALADRLAADLAEAVHLSSPVRRIEQSGAGVRVVSDRLTVDAKRVVVAAPGPNVADPSQLPFTRLRPGMRFAGR